MQRSTNSACLQRASRQIIGRAWKGKVRDVSRGAIELGAKVQSSLAGSGPRDLWLFGRARRFRRHALGKLVALRKLAINLAREHQTWRSRCCVRAARHVRRAASVDQREAGAALIGRGGDEPTSMSTTPAAIYRERDKEEREGERESRNSQKRVRARLKNRMTLRFTLFLALSFSLCFSPRSGPRERLRACVCQQNTLRRLRRCHSNRHLLLRQLRDLM